MLHVQERCVQQQFTQALQRNRKKRELLKGMVELPILGRTLKSTLFELHYCSLNRKLISKNTRKNAVIYKNKLPTYRETLQPDIIHTQLLPPIII